MRKLCPNGLEFDTETVAETIEALCKQTKALLPIPGQPRHRMRVVGFDTAESLFEPTEVPEIHLVPAFVGGKSGGFLQIVLGVVLIIAGTIAFFVPGGQALAPYLWAMGASMVLGGLIALLSPTPKIDTGSSADPDASKYLGAPKNTVKIGTRIPVGYGLARVFGQILSFNIDAKDVAATAGTDTPASPATVTDVANGTTGGVISETTG